VILGGFTTLRMLSSAGLFNFMSPAVADIVFSLIAQVGLMVIVPIIGAKLLSRKKQPTQMSYAEFVSGAQVNVNNGKDSVRDIFRSWGFNKPSGKVIIYSVILGLVMFLFNIFVSSMFNGVLSAFGHRGAAGGGGGMPNAFTGVGGLMVMMFIVAVLPGFCEEVTHRGFLMRGLSDRIGIINAITVSSLLFGLMHLNIVQFFYAMILGWLMAVAVYAMRSIWPAVIMHFMNNGLSVYLSFASTYGWFGGDFLRSFATFFGGTIFFVYLGAFIGLYILLVRIIHMFAKENFVRDNQQAGIQKPLHMSRGMAGIKYYITAQEDKNRPPLAPLEKTLLLGTIFLGTVVTGMTLVWGFF